MGKILVVDDEPEVCEYLEDFLGRRGHQVSSAFNGKEALEKIKALRPHIVLLDILMPGMNGLEVLKEARTLDSRIGIIMVTAVQEETVAKEALAAGAHDYITKPIDLNYLENAILVKIMDILG